MARPIAVIIKAAPRAAAAIAGRHVSSNQAASPAPGRHRYRLFGLRVASTMPLPDLTETPGDDAPDVTIDMGALPPPTAPEPMGLSITPAGAMLNVPEAGRYLVTDGNRIVVDPRPDVTERTVRLYLLGSAIGAVLHQRGLLPLHANVIAFNGAAVAFMGHSGAGKSTLASRFHDRGLPILGDDVCVVRQDGGGPAMAQPGLPRMRLWADALAASGRVAGDYPASFDDMDKYDVPTAAIASAPLPLAAIYDLRAAAPGAPGAITPLKGVEAVQALVANTYRGGFLPMLDGVQRHLMQCVALSRQVPVFRLDRRWGLDRLDAEVDRIDGHVRSVIAG